MRSQQRLHDAAPECLEERTAGYRPSMVFQRQTPTRTEEQSIVESPSRGVSKESNIATSNCLGGEFLSQSKLQTARLAVPDAGRYSIANPAAFAQIAVLGEERHVVDPNPSAGFVFKFLHHDAAGAGGMIVLLLARHLAAVTSRAIVVIDQECVTRHSEPLRR